VTAALTLGTTMVRAQDTGGTAASTSARAHTAWGASIVGEDSSGKADVDVFGIGLGYRF
jgi:hypothetical protein